MTERLVKTLTLTHALVVLSSCAVPPANSVPHVFPHDQLLIETLSDADLFGSCDDALAILRTSDEVHDSMVGIDARVTIVYRASLFIEREASGALLRRLLDDDSPVVRVCAFRACRTRELDMDYVSFLFDHLHDDARYEEVSGCIGEEKTVAHSYIERLYEKLNDTQRERLHEAVLTQSPAIDARTFLLRCSSALYKQDCGAVSTPLAPQHYKSVRRLVTARVPGATLALARYRRTEDIPIILERFQDNEAKGLRAMRLFPQERFIPALKRARTKMLHPHAADKSTRSAYFHALAASQADFAIEVFRNAVEKSMTKAVARAVAAHPGRFTEIETLLEDT